MGSITASCGCEVDTMEDLYDVSYKEDEDTTIYAVYCQHCYEVLTAEEANGNN